MDVDALFNLRESETEVTARLRPRREAASESDLDPEDTDDDEDEDEDDEETFRGDRPRRGEESMTLFSLDGRLSETAGGEAETE